MGVTTMFSTAFLSAKIPAKLSIITSSPPTTPTRVAPLITATVVPSYILSFATAPVTVRFFLFIVNCARTPESAPSVSLSGML